MFILNLSQTHFLHKKIGNTLTLCHFVDNRDQLKENEKRDCKIFLGLTIQLVDFSEFNIQAVES